MGQYEKSQQFYLSEKIEEAISAIRNTVIHDAQNLRLVPKYETKTSKDSTMDQELDIGNRVYEIATYHMRRVCVTIKKYNLNKLPYVQIRIFTGKENEAMKQTVYVNYTLNEFKELSEILRDFIFAEILLVQKFFSHRNVYLELDNLGKVRQYKIDLKH